MGIVDWVFPKLCSGCGREGKYICDDCRKKLTRPEVICPMCCKPSFDGWTHPRCKTQLGMERLIVGLPYKGVVQKCLKKVKYKNAWDVIQFLLGLCNFEGVSSGVVTSVPMWRGKERVRGFNQAETLAKLVAEQNKVPYFVFLERTRETKPMFGLKKEERQKNVTEAFRIDPKLQINISPDWEKVVVVDDVWTTGATMRECAKVLKLHGAREVWGVTLSR